MKNVYEKIFIFSFFPPDVKVQFWTGVSYEITAFVSVWIWNVYIFMLEINKCTDILIKFPSHFCQNAPKHNKNKLIQGSYHVNYSPYNYFINVILMFNYSIKNL